MSIVLIINKKEEYILIPNEAIRVRVIANSDSDIDIKIKEKVKNDLNIELDKILSNINSLDEARKTINDNIKVINNSVDKSLKESLCNDTYSINYGLNYFPEKEFKGVKYDNGYYESLVVTIGEGLGTNYWCVLYPPLCNINNNTQDVEYKLYIKEVLDKFL